MTIRILVICLIAFIFLFFSALQTNLSFTSFTTNPMDQVEKRNISRVSSRREQNSIQPTPLQLPHSSSISCDRSHATYDLCSIRGLSTLDPIASTFYVMSSTLPPVVEKLRPYPRKNENTTMARVKEMTITSTLQATKCEVKHNVSALVFSAGGFTGNFFHDFNDGFIPLFITVHTIFHDQDFVLVVANARDWWVNKYKDLLHAISKYPIITLNDTSTHCFPFANLGLISHGFMKIDPKLIPTKKTITHLTALLAKTYGHNLPSEPSHNKTRPRLMLMSREPKVGRAILNQEEAKIVAEDVGFDVIKFKPTMKTSLKEAYRLIYSSHVMVGVHGAALTHFLFMRPGSILVQVIPLGTEWVSEACFGKPARVMGLDYMEYRIGEKESSLVEKYGKDNIVVKDPKSVKGKGWSKEVMHIYLKEQNVKLDLVRFKVYLEKAYERAKKFMDKEG